MSRFIAVTVFIWFCGCLLAQDAPANEVKNAEYYLKNAEKKIEKMNGAPFRIDRMYEAKEAMKRVAKLYKKYPKDAKVLELFERVRQLILASKGDIFQITPQMTAYLETENMMKKAVAAKSKQEWDNLLESLKNEGEFLDKTFPIPNPEEVSDIDVKGKYVLLDDFEYPQNEFRDTGKQFVFVGKPSTGFYYVSLSDFNFRTAYKAIQKFKSNVSPIEERPWKIVGEITTIALLVPDPAKEKKLPAFPGWIVKPIAIYIPDTVMAKGQPMSEDPVFEGEEEANKIKENSFTVKEAPGVNATPQEVLTIFATAIKEKNYELYLECIDPERKKTKTALARMKYFWDNNQERYKNQYVHIEPGEIREEIVISGEKIGKGEDDPMSIFLTEEDKQQIMEHADPLVEEVVVLVIAYDSKGKQRGTPRPIHLRRYGGEGNRWYVFTGFPL